MTVGYWPRRFVFATFVLTAVAVASLAHAALRSPQVAVSGTALSAFFASQLQAINVVGSQQDAQRFSLPAGASFQAIPFGAPGANVGVYNASSPSPPLYQVFPGAVSPGWSSVASFRSTPDRLVVNLFDPTSAVPATNTYLGADRTNFGFYSDFPGLTAYSEDTRNPSARPQMLVYNGTGSKTGSQWFVFEATPAAGGDYADAIFLVTMASAPVPATSSSWNRVKAVPVDAAQQHRCRRRRRAGRA